MHAVLLTASRALRAFSVGNLRIHVCASKLRLFRNPKHYHRHGRRNGSSKTSKLLQRRPLIPTRSPTPSNTAAPGRAARRGRCSQSPRRTDSARRRPPVLSAPQRPVASGARLAAATEEAAATMSLSEPVLLDCVDGSADARDADSPRCRPLPPRSCCCPGSRSTSTSPTGSRS